MKRCGIVGYGRIGSGQGRDYELLPRIYFPYSLAEAIDLSHEGFLSGVSDVSAAALNQVPAGVQKFTSHEEMLNMVRLDFLAVTTRAPDRFAIFEFGVKKGIKLFHLEKPLCSSFVELDKLRLACADGAINFTYGTLRRHLRPYRLVKELIDSAKFGKIKKITVNYGAANLFWTHPHSIDLILFYIGEHREFRIDDVVGGAVNSRSFENREEIVTDPEIDLVVLSFDDDRSAEITNIPAQSISIQCGSYEFRINKDGREVVLLDTLGSESVIWSEVELKSTEGFKLVLDGLLSPNTSMETFHGKRAMLDAIEGQEILFKICLTLFLKQKPKSFSIDQNRCYFKAMDVSGLFA